MPPNLQSEARHGATQGYLALGSVVGGTLKAEKEAFGTVNMLSVKIN